MSEICKIGLGGAYQATERGQPMQVYRREGPFFPLDPKPEDLDLKTIAHALGNQCRFGGHVRKFYSVAQHCYSVSYLCPNYPVEGLLHDAAEAYLGDIIKPLKVLFPLYHDAERRMELEVATKWSLEYPWPAEVKNADLIMLATEKRDLVEPNDQDWGSLPDPREQTIFPWTPSFASFMFLKRAEELRLL